MKERDLVETVPKIQEQVEDKISNEIPGMFDGPAIKLIVKLCMPLMLGMLFQLAYSLVDTAFIGRIDLNNPNYVGSTGFAFPIFAMITALSGGLYVGVNSLVARAIGEKNIKVLDEILDSALFAALVLGVISMVVFYFAVPFLIRFMGAEGELYDLAMDYLMHLLPLCLFSYLGNTFIGGVAGVGKNKYIMIVMILGTVANIILDPIFIFVLDMKVKGAAIASVLGQSASVVYGLWVVAAKKTSLKLSFKFSAVRWNYIKKIFSVGLPSTLSQFSMTFTRILINSLITSIDPIAFTAYHLCGVVSDLLFLSTFAISGAMTTILGQNVGRKLFKRMKYLLRSGYMLSVAVVGTIVLFLWFATPYIIPFFSKVDAVINYATTQVRVLYPFFICFPIIILNNSFFKGTGRTGFVTLITIIRIVLLEVTLAYLFVRVFDLKMYGIWFASSIAIVVTMFISTGWTWRCMGRLEKGKFRVAQT